MNGHVKSLKESLYLDTAEVFVREFLGDQPSSSSSLRRAGSGGSRGTTPRGAARGAGSGKRGHRRASRGSRGSSGNLGDGGTGGSGSGQSGGRDGRPDSNSCSDSSLTALAGHCPLRRPGGYRGLALLVGFTERDVHEVARRVGAAAGAAAALEQGWVASLEQVCELLACQVWNALPGHVAGSTVRGRVSTARRVLPAGHRDLAPRILLPSPAG